MRKILYGLLLATLLSIVMLGNVKLVRLEANGTIYIRSDGSVDPASAPIQRNGDNYVLTDNIYDSIVVQRDNIVVDGAGHTVNGTGSGLARGLDLSYRSEITIKNMTISDFSNGIYLWNSSAINLLENTLRNIHSNDTQSPGKGIGVLFCYGILVLGNNVTNSDEGVFAWADGSTLSCNTATDNKIGILVEGSGNTLSDNVANYSSDYGISLQGCIANVVFNNTMANNGLGLDLYGSSNNTIFGNMIRDSNPLGSGMRLSSSINNRIYHNDFVNNRVNAYSWQMNVWDDGYPSGGNYWSDYVDVDNFNGPYQNITGSDGIWDHPYAIEQSNKDMYPLTELWVASKTCNVTWGVGMEPFYVTTSCIQRVASVNLNPGGPLSFVIYAGGSGTCNVTIPRNRLDGPFNLTIDETQTIFTLQQNENVSTLSFAYTPGTHFVKITATERGYIVGDINGDGIVNMKDIGIAAKNFGHKEEDYICNITSLGAPWPMFRHDAQHTGRSSYAGSITNNLKWKFSSGGEITSSPAVGKDGTIYFGSEDGRLYALRPDGTAKWSLDTDGPITSSPAISDDGTVYVTSWGSDRSIYAVSLEGSVKWKLTTGAGNDMDLSPVLDSAGNVYVAIGNQFDMITPDGTLKWSFSTGDDFPLSSCAIGANGTIYVGSGDQKVYAVQPSGVLKWTFLTDSWVSSSPAIDDDGTIYVGSSLGRLYAINPDGTLKWQYLTTQNASIYSSPAIGADGTIYVGSNDCNLYAINRNGTLKWRYFTGSTFYLSSAAISSNGQVYIGSGFSIYAMNPNGTKCWQYATESWTTSSPAIAVDGTVYIGSEDGGLYAFGVETSRTYAFDVTWGAGTSPQDITIFCNDSMALIDQSSFDFNKTEKWLSFAMMTGNTGFCNVTIPRERLDGPFTVTIDGNSVSYTINQNQNDSNLTFNYTSGIHQVNIAGTEPGYIIGDLNHDGKVDMKDIGIAAKNFGHKDGDYP